MGDVVGGGGAHETGKERSARDRRHTFLAIAHVVITNGRWLRELIETKQLVSVMCVGGECVAAIVSLAVFCHHHDLFL